MKRIMFFMLTVVLALTITACSSSNDKNNSDTGSNSTESVQSSNDTESAQNSNDTKPANETLADKIFTVLSKDDYTYSENQSAVNENEINKNYTLNDSNSYSSFGDTVTIEGTQIKFNQTKIADLYNNGWTTILVNADQEISANASTAISLYTGGGKSLSVSIENPSDNASTLKECVIIGITRGYLNDAELSLENNVTTNSTYTDYINTFGTPKKINFTEKYDGNEYISSNAYITFEDASGRTLEVTFTDKNNVVELYQLSIKN